MRERERERETERENLIEQAMVLFYSSALFLHKSIVKWTRSCLYTTKLTFTQLQIMVSQWLVHLRLVLEIPGSVPARDDENLVEEFASLIVICRDYIKNMCCPFLIGILTRGPLYRIESSPVQDRVTPVRIPTLEFIVLQPVCPAKR